MRNYRLHKTWKEVFMLAFTFCVIITLSFSCNPDEIIEHDSNSSNNEGSESGNVSSITSNHVKVTTHDCLSVESLRATVSGSISGVKDDVEAGIVYGRNPDLKDENSSTAQIKSHGDYSVVLEDLLDDETYYYCAYCVVNGTYYYGQVKSFRTNQLTYTIDGNQFKMIKVEGDGHSFSIMQTELPPNSIFVVDGYTFVLKTEKKWPSTISAIGFQEFMTPLRDSINLNFRLPTREEWEYAAKGGPKSQGFTYSGSNNINEVAWYSDNSDNHVHEIAQKKPNELGLYDMSGNYAEVCFNSPKLVNDIKLILSGVNGDICGGCWKSRSSNCKPTSWEVGSRDGYVEDSKLSEYNAFCSYYNTIRLIYTREK